MSFNKVISTAGVVLGLAVAGSVSAQEVSLEQLISASVSQVVEVTRTELQYKVQESVLTANNMISFDSTEQYATRVTITDLNSVDTSESNESE
ncbi:hypothetical protein OE749_18265 [Aestuariibacter sp. AA17]|uniref:Uncharacterized protein n=1 Tax=Fluctibacter corallii TaxID=2984329 RepID=A0ABT3ADC1_9ALTE|nr:hypothetical protein [Aestuariibacter sp. AA17]MCV2886644.1 hypothetical protein [Aestuariibacter sp. AA17]